MCEHVCVHTHSHACTHMRAHMHTHSHMCTRTHEHTCVRTPAHMCTHMHTFTRTHRCTCDTHAHTFTHMHTHMRTRNGAGVGRCCPGESDCCRAQPREGRKTFGHAGSGKNRRLRALPALPRRPPHGQRTLTDRPASHRHLSGHCPDRNVAGGKNRVTAAREAEKEDRPEPGGGVPGPGGPTVREESAQRRRVWEWRCPCGVRQGARRPSGLRRSGLEAVSTWGPPARSPR